jgi:soluble lytic murein transglycosylase-like protein
VDKHKALIEQIAHEFGLSDRLIKGIVKTESNGNQWAVRYEPNWKYFLTPWVFRDSLQITEDTERIMQATSWGLMQVMGSVARELGFKDHLTMLTDPELAIRYGCLQLIKMSKKYSTIEDCIAAYNAGSARRLAGGQYYNQSYVNRVLENMRNG